MSARAVLNTIFQQPYPEAKDSRWWFIAAAITLVVIAIIKSQARNYFDDAYMYVRYADHLIAGFGHSWNIGESSIYGTTSLLFSLCVALVRWLSPLDATESIVFLSAGFSLLSVAVLAYCSSHCLRLSHFSKSYSLLLLSLLLSSPFIYHANTGMDTSLAFLTSSICLLLVLSLLKKDQQKFSLMQLTSLSMVAFLCFQARPDNAMAACVFISLTLLCLNGSSGLIGVRHNLIFGVCLVLLLLADAVLKNRILLDALPLSFYAKQSGFYQNYIGHYLWNPAVYLLIFLVAALPYWAISRWRNNQDCYVLALCFISPVFLSLAYYFTVVQIMGHMARYSIPFLPYLIVLALVLLARYAVDKPLDKKFHRKSALKFFIGLVFIVPVSALLPDIEMQRLNEKTQSATARIQYRHLAKEVLPALSRWSVIVSLSDFSLALAKGSRFALSEYGYIGAIASELHIIDMLGLHDRHIAHQGFDATYVLLQHPDAIWLNHSHYSKMNAELIDHPYFQKNYDYYPNAFLYGFALRKQSLHHEQLRQAFHQLWQRHYPGLNSKDYLAQPIHY